MKQNFDFHIHTKNSDGEYETKEIISLLEKENIKYFSITDHDNIDSINDMKKINTDLEYITGIEFSGRHNGLNMHILGYYLDGDLSEINRLCKRISELREERVYELINDIEYKYNISFKKEDIEELKKNANTFGKPHIGKLLIKYGYASNMNEAFKKYLDDAHTSIFYRMSAVDIVKAIKSAGGKVILAHPKKIEKKYNILLDDFIEDLIEIGFEGIEVYNSLHYNEDSKRYTEIAKKYNLEISGGSDYHGPSVKPNVHLGFLNKENLNYVDLKDMTFIK